MTEFDPTIAQLTTSGATAALLLDAQQRYCGILIEAVLMKISDDVTNGRMTPDRAVGYVHELAAFRRIVQRQKNEVTTAQRIVPRQDNGA